MKFTLVTRIRKAVLEKKWLRLLLKTVGSLFTILTVLFLILLARLAIGPINLDFLTHDIQSALRAPEVGLSGSIEHTQMVWRDFKHPLEIELVGVTIRKDQNPNWLKIDHIGVSLRLYRLLMGEVSLKNIRIYHPQILIEREENGEFSLGFGEKTPNQEFSLKELAPLLALGGGSNKALGKLNDLSRISILNAEVILKDNVEDLLWDLPKCTLVLKRRTNGFRIDLSLYPTDDAGYLALGLDHALESSRFDFYANFHHIAFKKLIKSDRPTIGSASSDDSIMDEILTLIQHWDIPLNGKAHIALIPESFQVIEGKMNIDIEKGKLDLSVANLLPLPVSSGNLTIAMTPQVIEVKNASLLSEEMLINLSGVLKSDTSPIVLSNLFEKNQSLEVHGKIQDLFLDHLSALWPQKMAEHARAWITKNVRVGTLTEAKFVLKGQGSEKGLVINDLTGTLKGENAEITYIEGLPPASHIKVESTFNQKGFNIKLLEGDVKGVKLQEGYVFIRDLDTNNESLSLKIQAKGPFSDMLDVLDHKPLEYASYGGINPQRAKGEGSFNLQIGFPLVRDLAFKDVSLNLKGKLEKVEIEREITSDLTAKIKDGNFSVNVTQDQMMIQGQGNLNQLPSQLSYIHDFKDTKPYQLQIIIDTIATFDDFNRFGFDYREYGKGSTEAKLTFTLEHDKKSRLIVDLNTKGSVLNFPPLRWEKKAGEESHISFALVFKDGKLSKMKDISLSSPTYTLKGDVLFDENKSWKAVHLSEFKGPYTDTEVTLHHTQGNSYEATFKGQSVDVEQFLEYVNQGTEEKDHEQTDIKLHADVEELRMGEGKVFKSVHATADLSLLGKDHTWNQVQLRAKAGEGTAYKGDMANVSGGILFDIKPGDDKTQTLEVRANDAGQFLKNLSIYDAIQGGYITIKAKRKIGEPYQGVFKLKNFNATEIPLLARFAALLSPMGLANLFSENKTLSMDRFESNFDYSDQEIIVKNGIGKSISLGFTVEGKLDRIARTYTLKGNVIPARFINSILNNIPLIGPLISGGEGEGLFAVAYTVTGTFDKPEIALNPLTALAPGFIRKIFQSLGSDEE